MSLRVLEKELGETSVVASTEIVVNTIVSKRISWRVAELDGNELRLLARSELTVKFLRALADAIENLRVRVSLPCYDSYSLLPRYYLILSRFNDDFSEIRVLDILGIKATLAPTRWSYHAGYWYPTIQFCLSRILRKYADEMERSLQSER